ncbi:MAG: ATP-dependent zinc metalloprotease FtsH, partial [Chloroflexota bacterium]|nr:ATP-dependent zinc metalloprotease FtsH [Chloroflexota bacterium]
MPWWVWLVLAVCLAVNWLAQETLFSREPVTVRVPYTVFKAQVRAGNVSEIVTMGGDVMGTLRRPITYPPTAEASVTSAHFQTRLPPFEDASLLPLLESHKVTISPQKASTGRPIIVSMVLSVAPTLMFFGLFLALMSKMQGTQSGMFGLGRSRAKRYDASADSPQITFEDVAGIEEAEAELVEIVDFLKNPEKYQRLGGTIPKGVLLVGPPGTGKTLLARAVAGEAGVPFFSMSGSEFIEMVVGVGASRVRQLFTQARKEAPAIIFVDELDAVGRRRGGNMSGGASDEREQTLNQLLVEMDGFDAREAVIVLASTNRPDVLDPALLRPGRFDRRVTVQRPDRNGRKHILIVHTRGVPLETGTDLGEIAAATPGLVGADLRNLVNEAALLAARRGKHAVGREDFFAAMERLLLGAERNIILTEEDRYRVAYHEAGHALLGLLVPEADPVHKVTIVPRGQALGVTYQMPEGDRYNHTDRYLRGRIVGLLGGRAAEQIVFGAPTTGAEDDLRKVTELARQMVTRWGMSEAVGLVHLAPPDDGFLGPQATLSKEYSETLATTVDRETRRIIDEAYGEAVAILGRERDRLVRLAEALLAEESL